MLVLLSILEKFFLQDGAVSGRNEKDSRIFHNNLLETQIHQQYKFVSVKAYKKGEGLTSGWRAWLKNVFA